MFLSLKFIHSVLSSAPVPEGHCLPISDLSVRLFPGSLICHELSHVLFDGILGPCNASHLPTHSKCKRTHFLRAAICTGSFYSKVHNHLAVLCYLNSSVSSFLLLLFFLSFFFFLVNWVTDVLWLQNALKLFHMISGKRCLFKIHAEIIKLFNFTVNLSARDKSLFTLPASTHMTSQAIYFLRVSRVSF